MMLGRVCKLHRDLAAAKEQFATVVQLQPGAREGWEELLAVCRLLKDCTGEIAALEGLLNFAPKSIEIVDEIVAAARRCELDEVAIQYLAKKIELLPADWPSYAEAGRLYQKADNRIQAYFYFRQYVEQCPACPDAAELRQWCRNEELANPAVDAQYRSFLLFQQGMAAFQGGGFAEALRLLDQAQAIYGDFPPAPLLPGPGPGGAQPAGRGPLRVQGGHQAAAGQRRVLVLPGQGPRRGENAGTGRGLLPQDAGGGSGGSFRLRPEGCERCCSPIWIKG